jgi:hypothetical protein
MSNDIAPDGQVYVCTACGKRSKDRYGEQSLDGEFDESCMLNACSAMIKSGSARPGC